MQLAFGDTANWGIAKVHGNIHQIVEIREYTDFTELGDACKESKFDVFIAALEVAVKCLQSASIIVEKVIVAICLKQWFVILVNEHNHLSTCLFVCTLHHPAETSAKTNLCIITAIDSLPLRKCFVKHFGQSFRSVIFL